MRKILLATAAGALTFASADITHASEIQHAAFAEPQIYVGPELATWMSSILSFSGSWGAGGDCLQTTSVPGIAASTGIPCTGGSGGNVTSIASGTRVTASPNPIVATGTVDLAAIAQNTILANITSGSAIPAPDSLTAIIDADIGSTEGGILGRGSSWSEVTGTSGQVLVSQGTSGAPQFANPDTLSGVAQSTVVLLSQVGHATGSVAVPSGVKAVYVRVIGAGGPGGGGAWATSGASASGGGGGAGGGCAQHLFLASDLPSTIYYQAATGGSGGAAGAAAGDNGSDGNGNAQAGISWIGSSATTNTNGPWYLIGGQGGSGQGGQVGAATTGGGSAVGGSNPPAFTSMNGGTGTTGGFGAQPGGVQGGVGSGSASGSPDPYNCAGGGGGGAGNGTVAGAGGIGLSGPGGAGAGGSVNSSGALVGAAGAASYAGGNGGAGGTVTSNTGSAGSAGSAGLEAVSPGGAGGGGGASGSSGTGAGGVGGAGGVCGGGGAGGGDGQGTNAPGAGGKAGDGCVLIVAIY